MHRKQKPIEVLSISEVIKYEPDCSPPGYPHSRLLIIVFRLRLSNQVICFACAPANAAVALTVLLRERFC